MSIEIPGTGQIIADGEYRLGTSNSAKMALLVSGTIGGATMTPGYLTKNDSFVAWKDETETDIAFTANFQIEQKCGIGCRLALKVVSSTNPEIEVEQNSMGR